MIKKASTAVAVVDDESVRRALDPQLRSSGMEVKSYSSGAEFLKSV